MLLAQPPSNGTRANVLCRRAGHKAAALDEGAHGGSPEPAPLGCPPADAGLAGMPSTTAPAGADALRNTPRRPRGKAAKRATTSLFADLPDYLRDNEYITRYYRADYSIKESLLSLFRVHNETGNIWTHLTGVAPLLSLLVLCFSPEKAPTRLRTVLL